MQPSDRQGLRDRSRDVSCCARASTAVSAAIRPVPLTFNDARFCMGMHESSLPSASDLLHDPSMTFTRPESVCALEVPLAHADCCERDALFTSVSLSLCKTHPIPKFVCVPPELLV